MPGTSASCPYCTEVRHAIAALLNEIDGRALGGVVCVETDEGLLQRVRAALHNAERAHAGAPSGVRSPG